MDNNGSSARFNRVELLVGGEGLARLKQARVIIFGIGGVGSWAAEALCRCGVGELTLVDADVVAESNINRQLPALTSTVGESKVDVMRERLLDINPDARVTSLQKMWDAETEGEFDLEGYDVIIDAIDSLAPKALLILRATASGRPFFSAMGAALKSDPTRLRVAEFWKVKGCPLAAALRRRYKKAGLFPARKFKCVYSEELLSNIGDAVDEPGAKSYGKAVTNGALVTVTATAGMILASLAMEAILKCR